MMTKNKTWWWAKLTMGFTLPLIITCLTLTSLSIETVNAQENNEINGWMFGADRRDYKAGLDNRISQHGKYSATIESIVERPAISAIETELPKTDLHVHLNYASQSPENGAAAAYKKASALSKKMGVTFGIAEEFDGNSVRINDSLLLDRIALAKKNSLYLGLQVSRRDWHDMYSKKILNQVDYILADGMIFPNKSGRMLYIWVPGTPLGEPEDFMNLYVAHNLRVLAEPITIWGNATYLPDELISRYDELWTDARMKSLIDAAVKNNVAIEINSRFKVPNAKFIKMAKAAGAHFTFGSNTHGPGAGEISWSINMAKECGLTKEDFFIPKRKL
jgi:hypothetical protein